MLSYSTIFNRVRGKIDDPKELSLNEEDLNALYVERLHNVFGNQRIMNLFSVLTLDETDVDHDPEKQTITYELKNPSGDSLLDDEFVIAILVLGIVIEWLQPKVDSVSYTMLMVGGKEEKKLLDPYKSIGVRLEDMKKELKKIIRDRGYLYNSYIKET